MAQFQYTFLGSTIGAAWRPSGPSYPYYPAMPENWPAVIQASANWGAPTTQFAGTVNQFGPLLELLQHVNLLDRTVI